MQDLQIVVERRQPGRHFFFLGSREETNVLRNGGRRSGDNQLGKFALLKNGVQTVGQSQQGFARPRGPGQHRHVDVVIAQQPHGHGLLKVARGQTPEPLVHEVVPAIYPQIGVVIIQPDHTSQEVAVVIDKLAGIGARQRSPGQSVQGDITLTHRIDIGNF